MLCMIAYIYSYISDIPCIRRSPNAHLYEIPERETLQQYCRACDVLIEVNFSILEKLELAVPTTSPMVTLPMIASAIERGISAVAFTTTSHNSSGETASLSGPVTRHVMLKLSPAMGIPGIDMTELNRSSSSPVYERNKLWITYTHVH